MDRETFVATIKNILSKEITNNFDNSVVIGGLDLLLDNYHQHLVDLDVPEFTRYELFSHIERQIWVDSFIKLLVFIPFFIPQFFKTLSCHNVAIGSVNAGSPLILFSSKPVQSVIAPINVS